MHVQVNRPITLNRVTYGKGQHQIPDADAQGWFFDGLVKSGEVVVLRAEEKPADAQIEAPVVQKESKRGRKKAQADAIPEETTAEEGESEAE